MKKYGIDAIRNVALVGHGGAGKTSLLEYMLFATGAIDRLGRVDEGTTASDYDPDEIKREISINTTLAPCEWNNSKINFLDTPGYPDFVGDVMAAVRVTEGAIVVLDAVGGIEVGTETGWQLADDRGLAKAFFINKMDRENADFFKVLDALKNRFSGHGVNVAPVQLPIGSEANFKGVVDLLQKKAFTFDNSKATAGEIPADLQADVESYRESLVEAVAEMDDELLEKYFGEGTLSDEEIAKGVQLGIKSGKFVPVLCGASLKGVGIQNLLDLVSTSFPSPVDAPPVKGVKPGSDTEEVRKPEDAFSALVFKTMADPYVGKLTYFRVYSGTIRSDSSVYNSTKERDERVGQVFFVQGKKQEATSEVGPGDMGAVAKLQETVTGDTLCDKANPIVITPIEFPSPVFSLAIQAKTKADEDKLGPALQRLADEDPTFRTRREPETGQTLIEGLGDTHLDIVVDRLKRKFNVDVETTRPKIPYRETITMHAEAQGRHKKQTGGRGQFGDCWIKLDPLPRGAGYEFVDEIVGGAIPRQWIPSVDKGITEAMSRGILAGYPVVDVKATVYDGSFHSVDSSDMAFQLAGILAFQNAAAKAGPVILEPMMNVEVTVPEEFMGDVIGDLNAKRGRVAGMEPIGGGRQVIRAVVPQSEMQNYAIDLRSIARGRGSFKAEFSHYEEVPAHVAQQIIAEAKKAKEE